LFLWDMLILLGWILFSFRFGVWLDSGYDTSEWSIVSLFRILNLVSSFFWISSC
jgi:hypothetical protein